MDATAADDGRADDIVVEDWGIPTGDGCLDMITLPIAVGLALAICWIAVTLFA